MSRAQTDRGNTAEPVLIGGVPVAEHVAIKWGHFERGGALKHHYIKVRLMALHDHRTQREGKEM